MDFRVSFFAPFKRNVVNMGDIEKDKIIAAFEKIPWTALLEQMKTASESDIYHSPSLEIENNDNNNGLCLSAVGEDEWHVFFKRPKQVKVFFGLFKKMDNDYLTEITGQSVNDVRQCLEALIKNDLTFLEEKINR